MKYKIILLFIAIAILGYIGFIYMHEFGHQEIFRSYGLESRVEWFKYFPQVRTIPDQPCSNTACTVAHNMHDSIGYHLMVMYYLIMFSVIMFLIQFERAIGAEDAT